MTNLKTYLLDESNDILNDNIDEKLVINKDLKTVPADEKEPVERTGRGTHTVLKKNARAEQEVKMDKWHAGTRKQNVANCSDAKLKLNYEICKNKGYTREASILKSEANKRGIVLEGLDHYVKEEYYDINEYYNENLFVSRNYNV